MTIKDKQPTKVTIVVDSVLRVSNLPKQYVNAAKRKLTLKNPNFRHMKKRAGFAPAHLEFVKYYKINHEGVMLMPRGMLDILLKRCKEWGIYTEVIDNRIDHPLSLIASNKFNFNTLFKLRPKQKVLVEAARGVDGGILIGGVGVGKTVAGLKVAQEKNQHTLIIAPKRILIDQWKKDAKTFFGYDLIEVDKGGAFGPIMICTFAKLQRTPQLVEKLKNYLGTVIIDECHTAIAKGSRKILSQLAPKYLFGLTATCDRTDGQGGAIQFFFGDILCNENKPDLEPIIECHHLWNSVALHEDYAKMISAMVVDTSRNNYIVGILLEELIKGRKILVITKRIEHYKALYEKFKDDEYAFAIDSSAASRRLMKEFKSGKRPYSLLFGTSSLLSVGVDIPSLDTLAITCDLKSSVLTTQTVGRILRKSTDKKSVPKVIDFVDRDNPILNKQANARYKIYKDAGWETKNINTEEWKYRTI